MRFFFLAALAFAAVGYAGGAYSFYGQEEWAATPESVEVDSSLAVRHPEALLGAIRNALDSGNYTNSLLPYLEWALGEAPSFYQSALLLTVYRANRLEDPGLVRRGFETAIRLYPANGRLHLTFARWLVASRSSVPEEASESIRLARTHLEKALVLEEELVDQGLTHIRWSGVPAEEWMALLPDTLPARRQLLQVLVRSGYRAEAVTLLESMVRSSSEKELLQLAARWALQWKEPKLALDAATRWQEEELASSKAGIQLARATLMVARAHVALGDPDTAHRVYLDVLKEMEKQKRASRLARLTLMNGMGYAYLRQGQTVLARSTFLKARQVAPFHVDSSLGLARTYRQVGDRKAAIDQYRRVLELDRHHEVARRELEMLLVGK